MSASNQSLRLILSFRLYSSFITSRPVIKEACLFIFWNSNDLIIRRQAHKEIVREPAILLIKWLRPKGLKVCSYVKKYAEFKNQTFNKIGWYSKILCAAEYPGGRQFLKLALIWGTLYHRI